MDIATARKVLRLFSYGLYVVTSAAGEELAGEDVAREDVAREDVAGEDVAAMTANWVSQVSFDPRMLAVAIEKDAHTLEVVRKSGVFAVNVLASGDRELAAHLSRMTSKVGNKLAGRSYTRGSTGCPLLAEALAAVECRVVLDNPVGDHALIVGEVVDAHLNREGDPLTLKETGFKYAG